MPDELFPLENLFHPLDKPIENGELIRARIADIPQDPLSHSQLNQLMHLSHQAGMTEGFYRFYFLTQPEAHPFIVPNAPSDITGNVITSALQLRWGVERFALDAAFFFGDFTNAYRKLRDMSFTEIIEYFDDWHRDAESLSIRGPVMPLNGIDIADRHLVAETACKTLDGDALDDLKRYLVAALNTHPDKPVNVRDLVRDVEHTEAGKDPDGGIALVMSDYFANLVSAPGEVEQLVATVADRWRKVYEMALANTNSYLSLCPELDVYVATSMRSPEDFRETGRVCENIFNSEQLRDLHLRWFNPTISACAGHEDKGLIECLMVALARAVLYFAGTGSTWGKDAEAAMALSRGTPVIILCPDTESGHRTATVFRDVHPLSRLTDVRLGVAVGAIVTTDESQVPVLLRRLFSSTMEYHLERRASGGFVVREGVSGSTVRTVTADRMIRETFWNYYGKNYAMLQ